MDNQQGVRVGPLITVVTGWDSDARAATFDRLAAEFERAGPLRTFDGPTVAPLVDLSKQDPHARFGAVETTDPLATAATIVGTSRGQRGLRLDGIVIALDAPRASVRLATGAPMAPGHPAAQMLAVADAIVLHESHRLTPSAASRLRRELRRRVPRAVSVESTRLRPGLGGFDPHAVAQRVQRMPSVTQPLTARLGTADIRVPGRFDPECTIQWLDLIVNGHAGTAWRVDAVIPITDGRVLCAQSLGSHLDCDTAVDPSWPGARVAIVGRDLDHHCLTASLRGALID